MSCSSFLLLLLLTAAGRGGAAGGADCSGKFRSGEDNFVLDTEEAVRKGAVPLSTETVSADADCENLCCQQSRCNLALLEPRAAGTRTCVLFDCVYKNRFVCRFVNQEGYQNYIRQSVYQKYLEGQVSKGKKAPPIADAGNDVVVQPGESVDLSGVESVALHEAHITTYHWKQLSGDTSITMQKSELPDLVKLSDLKPGSYDFRLTVTDSNGQSGEDEVRVLVLSPEQTSTYCFDPVKVGPCRAAFRRWHYNATAGSCEAFTFGGCKANDNNFLSKNECAYACKGVTASLERSITLPGAEECGKACRPDQLTCDSGCCLDRGLECDGVKQCSDGSDESDCSKLNQSFSQLLRINLNESKALCTDPPRTGPCRAYHTRWYYNPLIRKCRSFTYGGCDGNENNFENENKCSDTCEGVTDKNVFSRGLFERLETDDGEENKSANIALALILSVGILVLLAILAYCFLRMRKDRGRRSVTTRPAHTPQSEQDTLVYSSTTKPL